MYQARPAVYVRNETGRTWRSLNAYDCWGEERPQFFRSNIATGTQVSFPGRCRCVDASSVIGGELLDDCSWTLTVIYQDTGEEIALIRSATPRSAPFLFFWRDRRYVLTVHENNGVEITERFW